MSPSLRLDSLQRATEKLKDATGDGRPVYGSLREYVAATRARFEWWRHVEVMASVLERVARDELKRVMFFMPPRHGKSWLISQLFPGYYLHLHPDRWVGLASYGATLAQGFSRNARDFYLEAGQPVSDDASSAAEWHTGFGGGMWSAGVGGPLTGRGGHALILDDPIKSDSEADSELMRLRATEWYASTFYTRLEPGAALIVVATRWHEEDLPGWLLGREEEAAERWHIVNLPAIREADDD